MLVQFKVHFIDYANCGLQRNLLTLGEFKVIYLLCKDKVLNWFLKYAGLHDLHLFYEFLVYLVIWTTQVAFAKIEPKFIDHNVM